MSNVDTANLRTIAKRLANPDSGWEIAALNVAAAADELDHLRKIRNDHAGVELSEENDRLIDENKRLTAALDIARTALLRIERGCEEGRAAITRAHETSAQART